MAKRICCPFCKSRDLQYVNTSETSVSSTGGGYSAGKGCLGYCLLGPLGFLCGACGSKMKINSSQTHKNFWVCKSCGKKFNDISGVRKAIAKKKEEKKKLIESLIITSIIILIVGFIIAASEMHRGGNIIPLLILFGIILTVRMIEFIFSYREINKWLEKLVIQERNLMKYAYIDE